MYQKAKTIWLLEGDVNSKFYHCWINKRLKYNGIEGMLVNNSWVSSIEDVKNSIHGHFKSQFSARQIIRPHLPVGFWQRKITFM